jgi:hypothetical protein
MGESISPPRVNFKIIYMRNFTDEQTIYLGTSTPQADFTAATTGIITSAAHGLVNGDVVRVTTTTTLPSGLSADTDYYVIESDTNTFQLSATRDGSAVTIASTGTGTHTYHLKGKVIYVGDWKNVALSLNFITTPTMTVKVQGSIAEDAPSFSDSQAYDNRWDYVEVIDVEDGTALDGDTGIACTGTADNRIFEANVSALKWITVAITAYTAGTLDVRVASFSD